MSPNKLNDSITAIINSIKPINFANKLENDYGTNLEPYKDKNGVLNIPYSLLAVVAVDQMIETAQILEFDLAKKSGKAYLYNLDHWAALNFDDYSKLLHESSLRMGYALGHFKTAKFQKEVINTFLTNLKPLNICVDDSAQTINLKNGTLLIKGGSTALIPHNKDNGIFYVLGFNFSPDSNAPLFKNYLDRVLPDYESQKLLQEWMGYIFSRDIKLEKIAFLIGNGHNGKSVLFEVILALLGDSNISSFSMKQLFEEHYLAKIEDKLLNYSSEINCKNIESDIFKILASGEPVGVRLKYGNPYQINNYAKLMFNVNVMPTPSELTEAFFRRLLIIHFDQTITKEEVDVDLAKKIICSELPGVLNWAIKGLESISKTRQFSACKSSLLIMSKYRKDSDPVGLFLDEFGYEASSNSHYLFSQIYGEYKSYSSFHKFYTLSSVLFSRQLQALGFTLRKSTGNKLVVFLAKSSK